MKTILTTIAVISLTWLGSGQKAEARGYESRVYISSYLPCGTPVYTERYFIGYDRCGTPIWGKRVLRPAYRPVVRPVCVAPCPPRYVAPRRCEVPRYGVNFAFQGTFSR
ncbi:MAG: hypothetical protein ABIS50_21155 [Luteolibacter sp.]|uniref:hypothetical protein n=1 Tax=Luteolibacter sp. TaxID=1962973 RepID=UPI00326425EE